MLGDFSSIKINFPICYICNPEFYFLCSVDEFLSMYGIVGLDTLSTTFKS